MIHVFKTSVETEEHVQVLKPKLDSQSTIYNWNFDLEDCDNILRVEGCKSSPEMILDLLIRSNFECQELE